MKIILTQNVSGLGDIGEIVEVKTGHARNYLLPQNLAVEANPRNMKAINHQKLLLNQRASKDFQDSQKLSVALETLSLTLSKKAGEQDKLFGSVTDMEIEKALNDQGYPVTRKMIRMDEPIKSLGVYHVTIKLHHDVEVKIKVWVIKE